MYDDDGDVKMNNQDSTRRRVEPPVSLRDQFAMAALAGLANDELNFGSVVHPMNPWPWVAAQAYAAADAMMEVRGE